MFVIYIYEQYNPETARRNTSKLKHSIPIEKTKQLPKQNSQPWLAWPLKFQVLCFTPINALLLPLKRQLVLFFFLKKKDCTAQNP